MNEWVGGSVDEQVPGRVGNGAFLNDGERGRRSSSPAKKLLDGKMLLTGAPLPSPPSATDKHPRQRVVGKGRREKGQVAGSHLLAGLDPLPGDGMLFALRKAL